MFKKEFDVIQEISDDLEEKTVNLPKKTEILSSELPENILQYPLQNTPQNSPDFSVEEDSPFTPWYTNGVSLFRPDEKPDVKFKNPETGESKIIVDQDGRIHNFPGIHREVYLRYNEIYEDHLVPFIYYRTEFFKYDEDRYIMLWQIQTDDQEPSFRDYVKFPAKSERKENLRKKVVLYAFLDKSGEFMEPFRLYSIGNKIYIE